MSAHNLNDASEHSDNHTKRGKIPIWFMILFCVLLVLFVISVFWGYSERNQVSELEDLEESSNYSSGSETIIEDFKEAFASGDYEKVRALFTDDGVLTTASNVHDSIMRGDTSGLADRVDEREFIRLATLHGSQGQEFTILGDPLMVGENTLAFAWEWGDGVNGTALLHLRDGKIVICILNPSQYQIPYFGE